MSLGGGTFTSQNKVLPGTYINFISVASANANLSDRGYVSMALELDWGVDDRIFEVTNESFQKKALETFGYDYYDDHVKGIRDLFKNAKVLYAYKLTNGGIKASNAFATAKYCGVRGNDMKVVIAINIDETSKFDVMLYLGDTKIDSQTVGSAAELKDNAFVGWKKDATLIATASTMLTGGTNGTADTASHQAFLDKIESYPSINVIGLLSTDAIVQGLYCAFTKRMRDKVGIKLQLVLYNRESDYEGIINVKNKVVGNDIVMSQLVYWVSGLEASCSVNKSTTNRVYDGEFEIDVNYTQRQLEDAINDGKFTLHKVGPTIRVLSDINSLITISDDKGEIFKDNQTIRVIDQIATDIANLFVNKYLGIIPNDTAGRISLWTDIVKHHEELQKIRAIENFSDKDIKVEAGENKNSVAVSDAVTIVNAMTKLYMTVQIQ